MSERRFQVRVGDHTHDVVVRMSGDAPVATVDGVAFEVRALGHRSVVRRVGEPAQTPVHLSPEPSPQSAGVDGLAYPIEVRTAAQVALERALEASGAKGNAASVAAPMPGRVVRVLVEEGARIRTGEPVVIVEAMKMENELTAEASGLVAAVLVDAGDTVDAGQTLVDVTGDTQGESS